MVSVLNKAGIALHKPFLLSFFPSQQMPNDDKAEERERDANEELQYQDAVREAK